MAVRNIGASGAWYSDQRQSGTSLYGGFQYGNIYGLNGVWYTYEGYVTFNISELFRYQVVSVVIYRNRTQAGTNVNYNMSAFVSKNASAPQPNYNLISEVTRLPGVVNVGNDSRPNGAVADDITSFFDITKSVGGWMGVYFAWAYPANGSHVENSVYLSVTTNPLPSFAPTGLQPTVAQNPKGPIAFAWQHNPNTALLAADPQTASQIEISQGGSVITSPVVSGNTYTLPANTISSYANVSFRVRTQTQYNDWGAWSGYVTFTLTTWPPLAPSLVYPLNLSVNAENGILLEWVYNSLYDSNPSAFDVRYRIDGGAWVNKHTNGALTVMTDPIIGQHNIEWQVLAYGHLGDVGVWSGVGLFYSIGGPAAPTILGVTNSNRPQVGFTAVNAVSFEMEFYHGGVMIYRSGTQPLIGQTFRVSEFFANGTYEVRLRISNQYGFNSAWVSAPFVIETVAPAALVLTIPQNYTMYARLYFDNPEGLTVYVFRAEADKGEYIRIAKTTAGIYDDYCVAPDRAYVYFVRVINVNFSFADSNKARYFTKYRYTTVALNNARADMLKLYRMIETEPEKERSQSVEKSFTQFLGRSNPVVQIGDAITKSLKFGFFCTPAELDRLEAFNEADDVLVIRDRRFGTVFCQIDGNIEDKPTLDGTAVSFAVRQVDYSEEVPL